MSHVAEGVSERGRGHAGRIGFRRGKSAHCGANGATGGRKSGRGLRYGSNEHRRNGMLVHKEKSNREYRVSKDIQKWTYD